MPVLVVLVGIDSKGSGLGSSACVDALRLRILLRHNRSSREFAELQFGLDAEQRRTSSDERRTCGERHIAGFDILYYIVFLAFIGEFKILAVEIKGRIGVIRHVELHAVADAGSDCSLYFLVEIEVCLTACRQRKRRIVGLVALYAHRYLHRALRTQRHAAGTENLFERTECEVHIEHIERLLLLVGDKPHVAIAVVALHRASELPVVVLLRRDYKRLCYVDAAQTRVHHIAAGSRVELCRSDNIRGCREVVGQLVLHKVFVALRNRRTHRKRKLH